MPTLVLGFNLDHRGPARSGRATRFWSRERGRLVQPAPRVGEGGWSVRRAVGREGSSTQPHGKPCALGGCRARQLAELVVGPDLLRGFVDHLGLGPRSAAARGVGGGERLSMSMSRERETRASWERSRPSRNEPSEARAGGRLRKRWQVVERGRPARRFFAAAVSRSFSAGTSANRRGRQRV